MKTTSVLCSIALLLACSLTAADYELEINGESTPLDLDTETEVTLPDGSKATIVLKQNDIITHKGGAFSFDHPKELRPSKTDLGEGVSQTIMISSLGTGVILQEYTDMTTSDLIDTMVESLTADEVAAGYEQTISNVKKTIGKTKLTGKSVVTSKGDEEWTRAVYSFKSGDNGYMIITMIESANKDKESALLEQFWDSLKIGGK